MHAVSSDSVSIRTRYPRPETYGDRCVEGFDWSGENSGIGRGAQAKVYACVNADDPGARLAVKVFNRRHLAKLSSQRSTASTSSSPASVTALDDAYHEIDVSLSLGAVPGGGCVRFGPVFETDEHIIAVMERLDRELATTVDGPAEGDGAASAGFSSPRTGGRMSVECAKHVFRHAFETLAALHGEGIAHLDIKPANIMIRTAHACGAGGVDAAAACSASASASPAGGRCHACVGAATSPAAWCTLERPVFIDFGRAVRRAAAVDAYSTGAAGAAAGGAAAVALPAGRPPLGGELRVRGLSGTLAFACLESIHATREQADAVMRGSGKSAVAASTTAAAAAAGAASMPVDPVASMPPSRPSMAPSATPAWIPACRPGATLAAAVSAVDAAPPSVSADDHLGWYDAYKADVWALGGTLYCCLFGELPFSWAQPPVPLLSTDVTAGDLDADAAAGPPGDGAAATGGATAAAAAPCTEPSTSVTACTIAACNASPAGHAPVARAFSFDGGLDQRLADNICSRPLVIPHYVVSDVSEAAAAGDASAVASAGTAPTPAELRDFLLRVLDKDPATRWSAAQAWGHPWLAP